jgi:general secretion pathway protein H
MTRRPRPAGFTLLELLIVVAVLGLALTITATVVMRPNDRAALNDAGTRVAASLRLARLRAMNEGRNVAAAPAADHHGLLVDRGMLLFRHSITVSALGPAPIIFAPDGSTSGGELVLTAGSRERTVTVDWLTGRISQAESR